MSHETPIGVSREAEEFLGIQSEVPGMEMGLLLAYGFEEKEPDGRITD